MKKYLTLFFVLICATVFAQEKTTYKPTYQFTITGDIKKESVITIDSLKSYPLKDIGDIKVTDHLGNFKHGDENLKGVLLKDILLHSQLTATPHLYSQFYFVCTGSDGYKAVYSWNELFNTEIGDHVYIVLEKNGKKIAELPESLQMVSILDQKTGRRYLHNLDKIVVSQAR
ncbi:MAG: hypothetical protein ACTHJ8_10815 [Mucilaginibacter sp.]